MTSTIMAITLAVALFDSSRTITNLAFGSLSIREVSAQTMRAISRATSSRFPSW